MDTTNKGQPMDVIRLPLDVAIASILGRKSHKGYRDIGHHMKVQDLYKLMGLTGSPMIYSYLGGNVKKIDPQRALVLLKKFNILVDFWLTPEDLMLDADNEVISEQIAYEPIREIIEEIVSIETLDNLQDIKRAIRQLIAKYY